MLEIETPKRRLEIRKYAVRKERERERGVTFLETIKTFDKLNIM